MKKITAVILLMIFNFMMTEAQTPAKVLIIDETASESSRMITPPDFDKTNEQAATDAIRKNAAEFWKSDAGCIAQSGIIEVRDGFFISREAKQLAVLYSLCSGAQGLLILERGEVAAHYGFKNESDVGISTLADIDKNGFDEILIRSEKIDARGLFHKHRIVEIAANKIEEIFYYQTYQQELNVPVNMLNTKASKIFVEKSANPVFYEEQFSNSKSSFSSRGQNIKFDSGWKQIKQPTKLENLPKLKIVEYFEIPR